MLIEMPKNNINERDETLFAVRFIYGICHLTEDEYVTDETKLTAICNLAYDKGTITAPAILFAAEVLELDMEPFDLTSDNNIHKIVLSTKHLISPEKLKELITYINDMYTLKGKCTQESQIL